MLTLLLIGILALAFNTQVAGGWSRTIHIRADGSIEGTTNIFSDDNFTHRLNATINDPIIVERSNIIIDGAGHTVNGSGTGIGFNITNINNVTIKNTNIKNFEYGVYLFHSSNNTVSRNNITKNRDGIHFYYSSSNNTVSRNNITKNNGYGVYLWDSSGNTMSGNNITKNHLMGILVQNSYGNTIKNNIVLRNGEGIWLDVSESSVINNNTIAYNKWGIYLGFSGGNTLRDNNSTENKYNFGVQHQYVEYKLQHFINDIDTTNIVDSKPIYYWVNQRNRQIPTDAGYVAVINSTNIAVRDLNITNNWQGVLFASTNSSTIENVTVSNNYERFSLRFSSNVTVSANTVTKNWDGIILWHTSKNTLSRNTIKLNDGGGIRLVHSNSNTIIKNTVTYTGKDGIHLIRASNNTIHHNNFVDNTIQSYSHNSVNRWDNGYPLGGNYWSDYNGTDYDRDGIGATPYIIDENNTDNYPFIGMFSSFNTSLVKHVNVVSNSTIEDFEYFKDNSTIKMFVSNMTTNQTCGFCRVAIPHALMNVTNIEVIIDNDTTPILYHNYTLYDNTTHRWIYFSYPHSKHEIDIIPEFPSIIVLPLFMVATLLIVMAYRRKPKTSKE